MKIAALILGIIFILFAVVQYNDPDPYIWAPYYLMMAFVCFAQYANRYYRTFTYLLLGLSILWGASYIPRVEEWIHQGMPSLVGAMKAETPYIENVREFGGILICVVVLIWLIRRNK